ncbi:MAG: hypothetical protein GKR95_05445 [Gammaproteobacteria bacterium]|nr:hypothetical protein [Gammaproteobacteria bacterium]
MKLLGRLVVTVFRASRMPSVDPLDEVVSFWRVLPFDLDLYGHMNNGRYPMIMDLARMEYSVRVGLLTRIMKKGWKVVIGSIHVQFKVSLKPFQKYCVHTKLLYWDDRAFYFRHEFRSLETSLPEEQLVYAVGYVRTVFKDGDVKLIPQDVIGMTEHGGHKPYLPHELLIRFPQLSDQGESITE